MAKAAYNPTIPADEMRAMIERATCEGRHGSPEGNCICSRCRQFRFMYHVEKSGGKGICSDVFCYECYKAIHAGSGHATAEAIADKVAAAPTIGRYLARLRAYRPSLEDVLILWASKHFRPAFEAYARADDRTERAILGRIVRERAARELGWLLKAAQSPLSGDLILLGPDIRTAGGYPMPPHATFADWVAEVRQCPI